MYVEICDGPGRYTRREGEIMRKAMLGVAGIVAVLFAADSKPGSATYVTSGDVQATLKRAPENSVSDQQIRVIDVGKVNVAVGAVYRSAMAS